MTFGRGSEMGGGVRAYQKWTLFTALALAWLGCAPVAALDPERRIAQYKHTRWTAAEGAPPIIYGLAQGPDGYLWIGSASGLHRFDGVTFEHIRPRERGVDAWRAMSVLAARDGTVWVGYHGGEIGVLRGGMLQVDRSAPRNDSFASDLTQTRDGTVWAGFFFSRRFPLLRRAGDRWEIVDARWGMPQEPFETMLATRDGSLWVTTDRSLLRLREGSRRFERVATIRDSTVLSEDAAGRLWLSDQHGSRPFTADPTDSRLAAYPTPAFPIWVARARFDRDGNLWGVNGQGLFRVRGAADPGRLTTAEHAGRVERIDAAGGLTATSTSHFLEDREGNIWVGTTLGLDQFRNANVVAEPQLTELPDNGFGMLTASDGTVYLGTSSALHAVPPGREPRSVVARVSNVSQICEDASGGIWVFTGSGLFGLDDRRRTGMSPPIALRRAEEWRGCAVDDRGALWVNGTRGGLLRQAGGRWQELRLSGTEQTWITVLIADRQRRLIGLTNADALVRLGGAGAPERVLRQLRSSDVHFLHQGERDLFVGGVSGLSRMRQDRFQTLDAERHPWLADLYGMAETPQGQTWLLGGMGIIGVATAELERLFDDPRARVSPIVFSFEDGMPNVRARSSQRGVLRGGDGRLWFATVGGLVWVDPARITRNRLPPPVAIRALLARGAQYRDPRQVTLAKGTSSIAIQYTGLSLTIPQRVRFRYRLEGVEDEWIEAGARREAYYTNLGPGTYRFHVIAANNDGVWNREGATLEFTIPPTFLQSIWFKLLCGVVLAGLAWAAYRFRLRHVTARLQRGFEVRIAERERIARELHDTLLQGIHGLMLRFQAVANRVPAEGELRASIDDALDRADAVLIEGRARVRDLRRETREDDVAEALRQTAAEIIEGGVPRFQLTVGGTQRPLHPIVHEEAQRIGEEAVRNAAGHAQAKTIEVLLAYGRKEFRMTVRDDGIGMPEAVVARGARAGHFGLVGMRERAEGIGGRLAMTSREGSGTEVALTLPARAAYLDRRGRILDRIFRLWPGRDKS